MQTHRKPVFRIWVKGHPQSVQGNRRHLAQYRRRIGEAAREVVPHPTRSTRIDVEIYFRAQSPLRPDIDNIIKPVLDGLKGVVYVDDSQVRSIKVASFPRGEAFGFTGPTSKETVHRLFADPPTEFLIDVYEGLILNGGPS